MKRGRRYTSFLALCRLTLCLFVFAVLPVRAQVPTYTSPQVVQQTLATSVPCTGSNQDFAVTNLGQTQHYATATVGAAVATFTMQFFGFDNAGNATAIGDEFTESSNAVNSNGVLTATGSFPNVKVRVTCLPATTGTFSLQYSGTSSTPPPSGGGYALGLIDKVAFSAADATVSSATIGLSAPYLNSSGVILFTYNVHSMAGSQLTVQCGTTQTTAGFIPTTTFNVGNSTGAQLFQVPAMPCPIVNIFYTHGTAVAGTLYNVEYVFLQPGMPWTSTASSLTQSLNVTPMLFEKGARWGTQTSSPGAGSQATTSKAAGAAGVRHVADCITWSSGAAAAPAATVLTINLRDGATGAGTVLWQTQVTAAATATQHGQSHVCGLNLIGSAATAMTLEFAAGLANEQESVALTGYDVQ